MCLVSDNIGSKDHGEKSREDHEDNQDNFNPAKDILDEDSCLHKTAMGNDNSGEEPNSQSFLLKLRRFSPSSEQNVFRKDNAVRCREAKQDGGLQ